MTFLSLSLTKQMPRPLPTSNGVLARSTWGVRDSADNYTSIFFVLYQARSESGSGMIILLVVMGVVAMRN